MRTIYQPEKSPLPADFIENVPELFGREGTLIHNARNQIKVFDVNGQKINVKKFCIPPIVNRILYSIDWRTPKAQATWQNAQKILENGFLTPRPYGYILEKKNGLLNFSYFISEQIDDREPLGYRPHSDELILALARYTAALHEKGLVHVDYTPNNILFKKENGQYSFLLVDINRFHFYNRPLAPEEVVENLMKPFHDDEQLSKFVRFYAQIRHADETLLKQVLRRRHLRNAYDTFKKALKKIPFASLFINKPLGHRK